MFKWSALYLLVQVEPCRKVDVLQHLHTCVYRKHNTRDCINISVQHLKWRPGQISRLLKSLPVFRWQSQFVCSLRRTTLPNVHLNILGQPLKNIQAARKTVLTGLSNKMSLSQIANNKTSRSGKCLPKWSLPWLEGKSEGLILYHNLSTMDLTFTDLWLATAWNLF